MRLGQTLQFLGVIDPQIRHAARRKAVLDSAPRLVELLRAATTESEKAEVDAKFKKIVDARTDEIMRELLAPKRSE